MSKRLISSHRQSSIKSPRVLTGKNSGIVFDVILNDDHPRIPDNDDSETFVNGKDTKYIGACVIRKLSDGIKGESELLVYLPLDPTTIDLPIRGEVVELVNVGNKLVYRRINIGNLNTGNSNPEQIDQLFPQHKEPNSKTKSYKDTSSTGITKSSSSETTLNGFGEYFEESQVNRLKLYEGDRIIQSRFGQSIRFSGYNNENGEFAPTILIRNRQNDVSIDEFGPGDVIEEDLNRDGSTIALVSGKYLFDFQPGTVDSGGSSDFETKPDSFINYPSEFSGIDQTLISSERIIISARSSEMIFYSKKNWGFISDGGMSIDNKLGADLLFRDNVNINIEESDFKVLTENGKILLNTESDEEPLLRGNKTVEVMGKLIDLITQQIFATPSGPTSTGPTNMADFKKLKSELEELKSTLNFTE